VMICKIVWKISCATIQLHACTSRHELSLKTAHFCFFYRDCSKVQEIAFRPQTLRSSCRKLSISKFFLCSLERKFMNSRNIPSFRSA
jgi:hypothetical protein